jgi:hypothetical protein
MQKWVKSIMISYTINAKSWRYVDDGKVFPANCDQDQKVRIEFDTPIWARTLRIYPQTWHNGISL